MSSSSRVSFRRGACSFIAFTPELWDGGLRSLNSLQTEPNWPGQIWKREGQRWPDHLRKDLSSFADMRQARQPNPSSMPCSRMFGKPRIWICPVNVIALYHDTGAELLKPRVEAWCLASSLTIPQSNRANTTLRSY